ncbi:unnamed protein product [Rotaria sordida]|uniref:G-protein coupled receptors family 1 profile domain-containing protein n=1 Tax=Rotaria sordida TaxID=392033 RepID=A0A815Q2J4_9BILA|nr:unnamed protein product [Rotaria sordida]CAF1457401.1 unnamed protein product [Rotaria sordida]
MSCNNSINIFLLGLVSGMTSDIRGSSIDQQDLMTFAYAFSVTILVVFGIISNIFSIDALKQKEIRSSTVGLYLIVYSCFSIFGLILVECRLIRMLKSFSYIASFIICNVVSGLASIISRICLWMSGFIAIQRSLQSFEASRLINKIRSRSFVIKQIIVLIITMILMHIHELIYRISVNDPLLKGNYICQIKYPPPLLTMNTIFSFIHIFVPLSLNVFADCLILTLISRRRATLHQTSYWNQWKKHFRRHCHLFLAPTLATVCISPQLILTMLFSCVDASIKWLLRLNTAVNLIIYIHQASTFFIFILPSESYFRSFKTQSHFGKFIIRCCRLNNRINPILTTTGRSLMETRNRKAAATIELNQIQKTDN